MNPADTYLPHFQKLNGAAPPWLARLRREAFDRFAAQGFPTTRLEDWKYTNVAPIARIAFRPAATAGKVPVRASELERFRFGVGNCLVFVDGRYVPTLSALSSMPEGTQVVSLAAALKGTPALVEPHLAHLATCEASGFTALNTAFIQDGALVYVPKRAAVSKPIHLLFISTAGADDVISHPRVLVVAEESSEATVVESYVGLGTNLYFTNAVTEIVVGANATLHHYKLQREGAAAFHVSSIEAKQAADSHFYSHSVSLGGALVRTDIATALAAPGCHCTFDGLYMASDRQHVDHHTSIDHREPHCSSRELYKGVLGDHSSAVFNGKVFVRHNAQKSDAGQANKNLLLSDAAVINTKPQLEILADDVKCSHGATIGRLNEDALFYLRSRGIGAAAARNLLIYAFANEVISRMDVDPIRNKLESILSSRLHEELHAEGLQ